MANLIDLVNLAKFAQRHPIASRNRSRTFERFVRWQFASRVIRNPIVVPFVGDTRLIISKSMPGAAVNYYFGLPEVEEVGLALHFLREGELMGDIGANIGALSVAAAGVAKARVIAMEPVPRTYKALCDNIAINGLGERVRALNAGAGATAGQLEFSMNRGGSDHIVTDGTGLKVEVRTLDEVFDTPPRMLVLDVEGFEPAVVAGAQRILASPELQVLIVETLGLASRYNLDEKAMHASLLDLGFKTVKYDPFTRTLRRTNGTDPFNTMYVRDPEAVQKRVTEAPGFRVDTQIF